MIKKIRKICCIGAGYVGGPTMSVIADRCPHLEVNVVDTNEERIKKWNSKDLTKLPIYEPGLEDVIERRRNKNLKFTSDVKENIANADMIFISVNTPTKSRGLGAGQASDLKWVDLCARQIAKYAKGETIVIEKSTLPVKTAQTINEILKSANNYEEGTNKSKRKFFILSNPEFLAEGTAISDLENPDRVLIGGEDPDAINALAEIYSYWVKKEKIITTDLWSSELSKLISNAFLAQRISSINSISALCEITGADIKDVSLAIGADKRIGKHFLKSGPGFGGSCFKKDILNLVYICNHYGLYEVSSYWQKVIKINEWQQKRISSLIVEKLFGTLFNKKISILGFSFKANTNDTRESPAINICNDLIEEGANLHIYDPKVNEKKIKEDLKNRVKSENINCFVEKSINECINNSHAIVIVTEWDEFRNLDWKEIYSKMEKPAWVFDTRNITKSAEILDAGFKFWRTGRNYF
tara:strand:- start:1043 stop:2449 length:1407 start_codon:yes stop_codon:yes gene_type:complete